jgi:hypothetical protein
VRFAALLLAAAVLGGVVAPGGVAAPATAASPGTNPTPCAPLAIRASLAEPRAGDIYLRSGPATCDRAEVEVAGRGLEGVFTVSFAVRYPAALLRYEGYATGTLMSRGSPATAPLYLVRTPTPGIVVVTMTRFAPDGGASAEGDAAFLGLRFGRVAAGNATIDFDRESPGAAPMRLLGAAGETIAARFGPGHGAGVSVP